MYMNSKCDFDFNLDNYTIEDIYNLFKLDISVSLDEAHLRQAKNIVVKMHPDKCKLPKEYFIFFNKAYHILLHIAECNQQRKRISNVEYMANEYYNTEIHEHISNNADDIRATFNRRFEKVNADMLPDSQVGHGTWFRSNEDSTSKIGIEDHSKIFEKHKDKYVYNENGLIISVLCNDLLTDRIGYSMLDDMADEFTSGMFGSLQYTDLKKSYTNSMFDISDKDFDLKNNRPQTIDQLVSTRKDYIVQLSVNEGIKILEDQQRVDTEISTQRAYKLFKQLEKSQVKNTQLTNHLLKY